MAKTQPGQQLGAGKVGSIIEQGLAGPRDEISTEMEHCRDPGPQPRLMTPEERAKWGPELELRKQSSLNRAKFEPALLVPYVGQWIAWSPDSSRIIAHADDVDTLYSLVAATGEDPSRCPIEGVLDGAES
jgi:hypothetical protein